MNVDEERYIGIPTDGVPTVEPTDTDCMGRKTTRVDGESVFDGYCRAWPGRGTDHVGQGRCKHHGGASPRGTDSPAFEHGLFSDYLDPEDRNAIDTLEEREDADKLDELINWRLARLRRAVKAMQDPKDQRTFWDAFEEIVAKTAGPEADEIGELARMLSQGNRAMQDEIDLVRKLIKDRNKIAEGEDVNVSWRQALAGDNS